MTKKTIQSWVFPDKSEEVEPGIVCHWLIYAYEGPGGLYPVGDLHRVAGQPAREQRANIIAQKKNLARGKQR